MTQRDLSPPPAFHRAVVQLRCERCGTETNAPCDCCVPYVPATQRVAEFDKANPGQSTRQAAEALGVSKSEVHRARQSGVPDGTGETVTGRDGKTYPARRESTDDSTADAPIYTGPKTPDMVELEIRAKLGLELVEVGYKAMADRFQYDKRTIARLKRVRAELQRGLKVQWF